MRLQTLVKQHAGRLSQADERLVTELLRRPAEAAFLSAAELSRRVGVHEATAVRLAQKLGYRGYPDLRADLRSEFVEGAGPAERVRRRLDHLRGEGVLAALVADEVAALEQLPDRVAQRDLDSAADALDSARAVFLFAQGHATALVDLLDRRLRRAGRVTVPLTGRGREVAERVAGMRADDLVVACAFARRPPGLAALLEHAREVGAGTVLVSDGVGPLVRPVPDVLLAAPRGRDGEFHSLAVPTAICNALVLTLAQRDGGTSFAALGRLDDLTARFEADASAAAVPTQPWSS